MLRLFFISCLYSTLLLLMPVKGLCAVPAAPRYDSSLIRQVTPDSLREQALFSDDHLHYVTAKAEEQGWFSRFIGDLLDKIFGRTDANTVSKTTNVLIWIISIGALLLMIWLLFRTEFSSFIRGKSKDTVFNFSDVEEDISGIDFSERIRKALGEEDYRLAVRWQYLKQLYLLNQKQLISWQSYKTNIDYTNELSKTSLHKPFIAISRAYEFAWYGKYEISKSHYNALEKEFELFEKNTGN